MLAYAIHRYARISPKKLRLVADLIRNRYVDEALDILRFCPKRGAHFLYKVLSSAIANIEEDVSPEELIVSEVRIDKGPTLKRWRPAAMGRAVPRNRRTSHIYIEVDIP